MPVNFRVEGSEPWPLPGHRMRRQLSTRAASTELLIAEIVLFRVRSIDLPFRSGRPEREERLQVVVLSHKKLSCMAVSTMHVIVRQEDVRGHNLSMGDLTWLMVSKRRMKSPKIS